MSQRSFVLALLIGLAILLSLPSGVHLALIPKVQATTTNITLYANLSGWNSSKLSRANPTITVTQGDTISFSFFQDPADNSWPHLFLLDLDNNMITNDCPNPGPDKCSGNITPTQSPSITPFTVTVAPGTYFYYCTYHSPIYMVGKFIVQSPPGPDYGISSSPSSLTISQGANANSTVSITSLNNFAGSVTLSSSPSSPPGLLTSSFSVNPVMVPTGGTAKSNFTISVPAGTSPGSYSLTVTGSNATTSRNTSVSLTVVAPDFTLISSPLSLNVPQGSSGTTTITLSSLNGFSGTVSLTSTLSSSGPQVTFIPASVTVPSGGSKSSTLSVSTASSGAYSTTISQGTYTVTITGTSGSLVHSTTLSLTVGPASGVGGLPSAALIGGGIAATVAVVAGIVYVLRRRPKTKT